MTIDEAIKLIQADIEDENVDWDTRLGHAYKISFEGLKHYKLAKQLGDVPQAFLLPGETE